MKISLIIVGLLLTGCTNNAMRQPEPLAEPMVDFTGMITVEHRKFVTLRTGQVCEVNDKQKIVACERNTYRYAESKADIRQMEEIENALAEQEEIQE